MQRVCSHLHACKSSQAACNSTIKSHGQLPGWRIGAIAASTLGAGILPGSWFGAADTLFSVCLTGPSG